MKDLCPWWGFFGKKVSKQKTKIVENVFFPSYIDRCIDALQYISIFYFYFSDDHTLVQLRPLPGSRRPEYINASFIDGFQKSRAYIATQVSPHQGLTK